MRYRMSKTGFATKIDIFEVCCLFGVDIPKESNTILYKRYAICFYKLKLNFK